MPDETERCEQLITIYAYPVLHRDFGVPLEILGDKEVLRGRLVHVQTPWIGLKRSPNILLTSSKPRNRAEDQASPFVDVFLPKWSISWHSALLFGKPGTQ